MSDLYYARVVVAIYARQKDLLQSLDYPLTNNALK